MEYQVMQGNTVPNMTHTNFWKSKLFRDSESLNSLICLCVIMHNKQFVLVFIPSWSQVKCVTDILKLYSATYLQISDNNLIFTILI
jgi:hypothetical protein